MEISLWMPSPPACLQASNEIQHHFLQESAFIYYDPWEYRTDSKVHIHFDFHHEEHWGDLIFLFCFSPFVIEPLHICFLLLILFYLMQNISSDILGFTGDEATRKNLKLLIKSLSRLLWRWEGEHKIAAYLSWDGERWFLAYIVIL
jgi:hypothetical protein